MAKSGASNGAKKIKPFDEQDTKLASGKLTRGEYGILKDGLNWRKGSSYDKELDRLQKMYPTYFPRA